MQINLSYDEAFSNLWKALQEKYPKSLFEMDGTGSQLDLNKFSSNFFTTKQSADVSVDSNANVDDNSVITYNTELPKPFFKLNSYYMLWKELRKSYNTEMANDVIERQISGDIYINDQHGIAGGLSYCFNYSTYDIMLNGLPMIKKIKSIPPKYLYSFKSQLEQFTIIAANSTLGATGLADLFLIMSYYVKNILTTLSDSSFTFKSEKDAWKYIKENIVSFIYTINQPLRGNQSCFTNVSIYDDGFLESLKDDYIFPDGSKIDVEIVKKIQNLFLTVMNIEMKRTPITFPVTTACFSIDENNNIKDEKFLDFIAKHNKDFGFINMYCGTTSTLSSCCRLRSSTDNEYFNSFGSGSSKIGSLGVVTINLPRLAYKNKEDKKQFLIELGNLVKICSRINNVRRRVVQKRADNGNHPLYSLGFISITKQYSTVGINGFNECIEILGENILTESGTNLGLEIINTINEENDKLAKYYKTPHNCEQIPAENVSVKLATKDKILGFNKEYSLYSNQFIPLTTKANLLDKIYLQGVFDKHFSGGAIAHLNVDTKIDDIEKIKDLIKYTAKSGVIYFAINYVLGECEKGHMSIINNTNSICSVCGGNIINEYTRVVGFLTNTKNWNKTRREKDYPNRTFHSDIENFKVKLN